MKNIYRFVLIAVAAMGFVACSMENEPVVENKNEVHTISVVAGFDATRSGFGELAGDSYKQVWDGTETIVWSIVTNDLASDMGNVANTSTGSSISFDISTAGIRENVNGGKILLCTPMESAIVNGGAIVAQVPSNQTPLENSCDPKAHVLTSETSYEGDVKNLTSLTATFQHYSAYGRMTFTALPTFEEGATIKDVVLNIGSYTYVLNPENVKDNVYWFGCTPAAALTAMTVTIRTTDNYSYTKTLNLEGKDFAFTKGELTQFKVNMSTAEVIAPEGDDEDEPVLAARKFTHVVYDEAEDAFKFYNEEGDYVYVELSYHDIETIAPSQTPNAIKPGEYTWRTGASNTGLFRITSANIESVYYQEGTYFNADDYAPTMSVRMTKDGKYIIDFTFSVGYSNLGYRLDYEYSYAETEDELMPFPSPLATPENVEATVEDQTVTVTWDPVDNAETYYVWCSNDIAAQTVTGASATFEGLTEGAHYKVTVRALPEEGSLLYKVSAEGVIEFDVPYGEADKLATPAITGTEVTDSTVTVNWDAVTNATEYVVTCGDKEPATVANTVTTYTFEGLDAETEYTISVVAKGDGLRYTDSDAVTTTATTDVASGGGETGGTVDMSGAKVTSPVLSSGSLKFNLVKDGITIACNIKFSGYSLPSSVTVVAGTPSDSGQCGVTIGGTVPTSISGTIDIPKVPIVAPFIYGNAFDLNFVADGKTYIGQSETVQLN